MDIINGGRALMNIRHKLNILIKNKRNLDFNIDDAEISYLSKGRTNDSYLLDFNNSKLVLRLNSKNDFDLGINRENEALILKTLDNQSFMPNLIYIDEFYKFIIYEYIEAVNLDLKKTNTHQKKEILKLIDTLQEIKIDLPKFNYFSHLSGYWEKIKTNKDINISKIEDIEKFLVNLENFQKSDWSSSLTHHDLETNILESSNGYKIIDWEYASNGHYSFDRHSLGLMNDNKMLNELIKFMNYFWSLINKKD